MSASLLVLGLAALAMVAALVSVVVHAALPWLDRLAVRLAPRHGVRLWLGLAALPIVVGSLAITASFLPAMGIGHDHCLAHGPHHPHLCPHHLRSAPGLVLFFIAGLLVLRLVQGLYELARNLRLSRDTSVSLAQASERHEDALVFPSDEPQAFVLGALRSRVLVSRGLLALGPDIVEPVLAHERVHARRRDMFWRALCPVLAVGHLPVAMDALRTRVAAAQELAADAEAAESLTDGRLKIAEALLVLARLTRAPAPALAFTHGNLKARVQALLEGPRALPVWPARLLLLGAALVPLVVGACHDLIHHGLETLLGVLS